MEWELAVKYSRLTVIYKEIVVLPAFRWASVKRIYHSSTEIAGRGADIVGPIWSVWHGTIRRAMICHRFSNLTCHQLIPSDTIEGLLSVLVDGVVLSLKWKLFKTVVLSGYLCLGIFPSKSHPLVSPMVPCSILLHSISKWTSIFPAWFRDVQEFILPNLVWHAELKFRRVLTGHTRQFGYPRRMICWTDLICSSWNSYREQEIFAHYVQRESADYVNLLSKGVGARLFKGEIVPHFTWGTEFTQDWAVLLLGSVDHSILGQSFSWRICMITICMSVPRKN